MRIIKLSLIEETDTYYIFSVSFKSFFGEKYLGSNNHFADFAMKMLEMRYE